MDKYTKTNLLRWNEATTIHKKSRFYDVEGFKAGKSSLKSIEIDELGDVEGKSLLHLQCHFGLDSLSFARLGANVTGIDFSDEAISLAKQLSQVTGIKANFICSDIFELPNLLNDQYDIVFTSYGVLCWLSDLDKWGKIISRYLKPGGTFLIVEGHPLANIVEYDQTFKSFSINYSYFSNEPILCQSNTTYGDTNVEIKNIDSYQWDHSISDIINSLIQNDLKILRTGEYPFAAYEKFEGLMTEDIDGWWKIREGVQVPLLFSVKATK
jgi:SAM-dependent methyltransferase